MLPSTYSLLGVTRWHCVAFLGPALYAVKIEYVCGILTIYFIVIAAKKLYRIEKIYKNSELMVYKGANIRCTNSVRRFWFVPELQRLTGSKNSERRDDV